MIEQPAQCRSSDGAALSYFSTASIFAITSSTVSRCISLVAWEDSFASSSGDSALLMWIFSWLSSCCLVRRGCGWRQTRARGTLTTGTSNSYKPRHAFASGLMMSTSLKANGRLSHTSDNTDLACVHNPQFSRVKRVIRQDWSSLLVTRMVEKREEKERRRKGPVLCNIRPLKSRGWSFQVKIRQSANRSKTFLETAISWIGARQRRVRSSSGAMRPLAHPGFPAPTFSSSLKQVPFFETKLPSSSRASTRRV